MKVLAVIRDEDLGWEKQSSNFPHTRIAARSIVTDKNNLVALMFVAKSGYHKLPGGGLEGEETITEGLNRELMEEVGCLAKNFQKIGTIEEYVGRFGLFQTSHCFVSDVDGSKGSPSFDAGEIANEFSLKWVALTDAIDILSSEKNHNDYQARFINMRDLTFLKTALKFKQKGNK